jgi:regulator of sirC expression with transglutaminase-like and TPR domain
MEATERFASALAAPATDVRLDVAALCIAAHAHPGLDIDAWCGRLDELAAACPEPTFDGLRTYLFEREGFAGNTDDYADPENSFLDSVVARRTGIPITLSVVMIEVGRRLGMSIAGVGMPGHFLVKDPSRDEFWCDPFHGGALYDVAECRAVFARIYGGESGFHPAYLAPISPVAIVARMLANLEQGRLAGDPRHLAWMYQLHAALPQLHDEERAQLQAKLATLRARWN